MKRLWILAAVILLTTTAVHAFDTTPLQIGIWPPTLQIVPPEINVSGLKLNLPYGGNDDVVGVDLGFFSTSNNTSALQINPIFNLDEEDYKGLQVSLFNLCGQSAGIQIGVLMNSTDRVASGVQIGLVNSALEMNGLQIGLVNYSNFMVGVQIGLVNVITDSIIPFFPIINFCF